MLLIKNCQFVPRKSLYPKKKRKTPLLILACKDRELSNNFQAFCQEK